MHNALFDHTGGMKSRRTKSIDIKEIEKLENPEKLKKLRSPENPKNRNE